MYKNFQNKLYTIILKWFKEGNILDKNIYDNITHLGQVHGNVVFQVLFDIIANLSLTPVKAEKLWIKIWKYKNDTEKKSNKKVDFRVALLEYLLEINHKLKNPKIIEMNLFEKTQSSLIIDELTQLYNYRFFKNQLKYEISRAKRLKNFFAILLIDVDNFKKINDTYGHEDANLLLKKFAKTFKETIRKDDLAFRYGGDEFIIFLHNTNKMHGFKIAEKIKNKIEKTSIKVHGNKFIKTTLSIGVSSFPLDADTPTKLIQKADKAIQASKRLGKNTVSLYSIGNRSLTRVKITKKIILGTSYQKAIKFYNICDISHRGISFYKASTLEVGTYSQFFFNGNTTPFAFKVVRVNKLKKDKYIIGGSFIDIDNHKSQILDKYIKSYS